LPPYTASARHPEVIYVKAGTLDDPCIVRLQRQIWLDSAVPWRQIDPDLPGFAKGSH